MKLCGTRHRVLGGVGLWIVVATVTRAAVDFGADVRPILSDNCFACHGPDDSQRKAKLRLDMQEGALGERGGYPVIVPGQADKSELVARITSGDETEVMPPPAFGKSLTKEQIAVLRQWIEEGAAWEEHWSFQPLKRPAVPEVEPAQAEAVRNPIDHFIIARLQREHLEPAPEADRATLLRRVTFDLTGLPPSVEEVDAFLSDPSPDAYEKVVDRLLASPRYGEHRARYWLDAARYGDTHGLHLDNYREMWPYRDWVVRAYNENKPFDEFVIEQLAGDLLDDPTDDQLVATGFNRCHVSTSEGGSIEEEVHVRNVVDRVVTTGSVLMGLTLDCTRCHDHKFDPLTMNDFYSLSAYFNSLDGPALDGNRKDPKPVLEVPSAEQRAEEARLNAVITLHDSKLKGDWPEVDALQAAWEKALRESMASEPRWLEVRNFTAASLEAPYLEAEGLEADVLETEAFKASQFKAERLEAKNVSAQGFKAVSVKIGTVAGDGGAADRPAAIALGPWHSLGPFNDNERYLRSRKHGPEGRSIQLEEEFETETGEKLKWRKRADYADGKAHTDLPGDQAANFLYRKILSPREQTISISLGSDDGIRVYLNNRQLLNQLVQRGVQPDQEQLELPLKAGENHLLLKILNFGGGSGYYFALKSEVQALPEAVYNLTMNDAAELDAEQEAQLRDYYRNQVAEHPEVVTVKESLQQARADLSELKRQIPTTLIYRESEEPREAFLLRRGEYDKPGEAVQRRTPRILPPMDKDSPNNRLGLARWLVDREHPLTARVAVNRFWQQLFGTGLVKTAEDFGSQGEPPSHPGLLDWLAIQLVEDGWDVKRTMKRLVMSATYRQSSRVTRELLERDPANRLLARGPRFRLDAEMLRDQALFVSGLLNETMGGPSVKPPQPDGLWFAVGYSGSNTVRFKPDEGDDKVHRRTLYTFIKRTAPPPQMSTFDAPSRESCTLRRERTNTPLQALLLWNDPQYVEAARGLAQRVLERGAQGERERAEHLLRLATGRRPCEAEIDDLLEAVQLEREHYRADEAAAAELIRVGSAPLLESVPASELAAWTLAANLVLNLDEVIVKN